MEYQDSEPKRSGWRAGGLYVLMIGTGAAAFLLIRNVGGESRSVGLGLPDLATQRGLSTAVQLLIALMTIVSVAQLTGRLFAWLKQPMVVGEIVAGLVLGPSLLGTVAPGVIKLVLPAETASLLSALAQLGVLLYMFLIGLELDPSALSRSRQSSLLISHASMMVPFVAGAALSLLLYPRFAASRVSFTVFAMFCGVAMSVTAFPVLARILRDRGMSTTLIGTTAIACAAVDDVTAWCLLAFVISLVKSEIGKVAGSLVFVGVYVFLMLRVIKPALKRWLMRYRQQQMSQAMLALVLLAVLLSALASELLGIHAIFGAFLAGVVIPSDSSIASGTRARIEDLVSVLLLPIFFVCTGTRVQVGLLQSAGQWGLAGLVLLTACVGKFGGTAIAARLTGIPWHGAAILGTLMNTRGLVELIVLNIGLDMGVLSRELFTMFVLMAVLTTAMTSPLLSLLEKHRHLS